MPNRPVDRTPRWFLQSNPSRFQHHLKRASVPARKTMLHLQKKSSGNLMSLAPSDLIQLSLSSMALRVSRSLVCKLVCITCISNSNLALPAPLITISSTFQVLPRVLRFASAPSQLFANTLVPTALSRFSHLLCWTLRRKPW
jgi:hypothetical protein